MRLKTVLFSSGPLRAKNAARDKRLQVNNGTTGNLKQLTTEQLPPGKVLEVVSCFWQIVVAIKLRHMPQARGAGLGRWLFGAM